MTQPPVTAVYTVFITTKRGDLGGVAVHVVTVSGGVVSYLLFFRPSSAQDNPNHQSEQCPDQNYRGTLPYGIAHVFKGVPERCHCTKLPKLLRVAGVKRSACMEASNRAPMKREFFKP